MLTVFHVVIGVIIAGGSDFVLVSVGTPFYEYACEQTH